MTHRFIERLSAKIEQAENTYLRPDGKGRHCKICSREGLRERTRKRRMVSA